jgi:anthranilate phosphoribosyltransferase
LLNGEKSPYRDIAVLNAAAALVVAEKSPDLKSAARMAEKSIDHGSAKDALDKLVKHSNGFA